MCVFPKAKEFMSEENLEQLVRPTVDFVLGLQFPKGNFPSSLANNKDRLVHWCHGAPGVIHLLLKAHEVNISFAFILLSCCKFFCSANVFL